MGVWSGTSPNARARPTVAGRKRPETSPNHRSLARKAVDGPKYPRTATGLLDTGQVGNLSYESRRRVTRHDNALHAGEAGKRPGQQHDVFAVLAVAAQDDDLAAHLGPDRAEPG